jgi:type II secretory pathway pseudopilin PulG
MATNRTGAMVERRSACARCAAFTLIDLLVSLAIIGVLIGILLPTLSGVREATRKVVCSSNQRQHGLGIAMYADDHQGQLPETRFLQKPGSTGHDPDAPQNTIIARRDVDPALEYPWDGLGVLFEKEYLNAPQVFYCPSHHGDYPMAANVGHWSESAGKIVTNYQYRGDSIPAAQALGHALISDGLATRDDFSHTVGANVLRYDYSVNWVPDVGRVILNSLPASDGDITADQKVLLTWGRLDLAR